MTKQPRNIAASVRQRLLNLAKERGDAFEAVLVRYALERLLYRLTQSPHADRFVLKGALLFNLWFELPQRPTRDADFLGFGDDDPAALQAIFSEMVADSLASADDGLLFDIASLRAERIRKEAGYPGVRIAMTATLAGFNSRMKDFFDLWVLLNYEKLDRAVLPGAVRATFRRRGTAMPQDMPAGLSDAFAQTKQPLWKAFLASSELTAPPLPDVMPLLRETCWPLLRAAADLKD